MNDERERADFEKWYAENRDSMVGILSTEGMCHRAWRAALAATPTPAQAPAHWMDVKALEVARRFTQDTEGQRRASLQCAVVEAMQFAAAPPQAAAQAGEPSRAVALLRRLCELSAADRPIAKTWGEAEAFLREHAAAPQAAAQAPAAPLTESYVQPVPDKCDRITWRGRYYHLETLAAPAQASQPCELCNALIVPRNMTHYDAIDLSAAQKRAEILHSRIKIEHDPVAQAAQPERSCDKIADALRECLPLVAGLAAGLQDDGEDAAAAVALAVIEVSKKRLAEYAAQAAHSAPVAFIQRPKVARKPGQNFIRGVYEGAPDADRIAMAEADGDEIIPLYDHPATQTPRPNEPDASAQPQAAPTADDQE